MAGIVANRKIILALLGAVFLAGLAVVSRQIVQPSSSYSDDRGARGLVLAIAAPGSNRALSSTTFEVELVHPERLEPAASVSIALTMPAMAMPENRFSLRSVPEQPGRFRGTGVFTMKGKWDIEAIAQVGSATVRVHRPVEVN